MFNDYFRNTEQLFHHLCHLYVYSDLNALSQNVGDPFGVHFPDSGDLKLPCLSGDNKRFFYSFLTTITSSISYLEKLKHRGEINHQHLSLIHI